jgi:hypothetical protein
MNLETIRYDLSSVFVLLTNILALFNVGGLKLQNILFDDINSMLSDGTTTSLRPRNLIIAI